MVSNLYKDYVIDCIGAKFVPRGYKTLSIVFSTAGQAGNKFTYFKVAHALESDLLFVKSPNRVFYRGGLRDFSSDLGDSLRKIDSLIKAYDYSRVLTIGSSMGGYGANLWGVLLGVDHIVAAGFTPLLNIPSSHAERYGVVDHLWHVYPDTRNLTVPQKRTVIYGDMCLIDVMSAAGLANEKTSYISVDNADHGVLARLHERNELDPILQSIVLNDEHGAISYGQGLAIDPKWEGYLSELNYLIAIKNWSEVISLCNRIQEQHASLPNLIRLYKGKALYYKGQYEQCLTYYRDLELTTSYWEPTFGISCTYDRLGDLSKSTFYAIETLIRRPVTQMAVTSLLKKLALMNKKKQASELMNLYYAFSGNNNVKDHFLTIYPDSTNEKFFAEKEKVAIKAATEAFITYLESLKTEYMEYAL
jgi:hypothetical protein